MLVETSIQSIVWAPAARFIILDSGFRQYDDLGIRQYDGSSSTSFRSRQYDDLFTIGVVVA